MSPLLTVRGLVKAFGGVHAVDDVSFEVGAGELLALIGPNGAGKSTCFNLINGQLRPDAGDVLLEGDSIVRRSPSQIWRMGVGRTFQIAATFASLTVVENVQMALLSRERAVHRWWRAMRMQQRDEAEALLELVGMRAQADRAASVLAYGDIKRVELAVALANRPKLLLMDEPTAGMAPAERGELMTLTSRLTKERNIGVLFTEHSMDVVFSHADRLVVLARGRLIAQGDANTVRGDRRVQEVYLGTGAMFERADA